VHVWKENCRRTHPSGGETYSREERWGEGFVQGDCFEGLASGIAIETRWCMRGTSLAPNHAAWDLEAAYIAQSVANYTLTLSPQRIIIGGRVRSVSHLLLKIKKRTRELINGYIQSSVILENIETYMVHPGLGNRSGVLGAIALAEEAVQKAYD
jgi:fructokinase